MPFKQRVDDYKILDAINRLWLENYRPPTLQEILSCTTETTSTSTLQRSLQRLEEAGEVITEGRGAKPVPAWVVVAIESYFERGDRDAS